MEYNNFNPPVGVENQLLEPLLKYSHPYYRNKNQQKTKKIKKQYNNKKKYNNNNTNNSFISDPTTSTQDTYDHIRESRNEEDEQMLNYIQHNIFDDQISSGTSTITQNSTTP